MITGIPFHNKNLLTLSRRKKRSRINTSFSDAVIFRAMSLLPILFLVAHANWQHGMLNKKVIESEVDSGRQYEKQNINKLQMADNYQVEDDIG